MFGQIEVGLILFYCITNLVIIILSTVFRNKKGFYYIINNAKEKWDDKAK